MIAPINLGWYKHPPPGYYAAQQTAVKAVTAAVRKGTLVRPKRCALCKRTSDLPIRLHHEDYERPLWVIPLCSACHSRRHGADYPEMRPQIEEWLKNPLGPQPSPSMPRTTKTPTIGERIKAERERRGITREKVALELGESPPVVRGWEKGFNRPESWKLVKIEAWLKNGGGR